ncbi:hypothetical protein [Sphingomonas crocodyli]|uniref:Uncharacterized protein n=1 Tax=Sphingomonas crocodyli TaxID=1979270 RepID=A0A437LY04_9SPHN|nr:hypothetical protein [Sphingomonas crocodyli]RVT90244.1 hypothetical protein EOD43_18290 [Sphingomonas crocodyli]
MSTSDLDDEASYLLRRAREEKEQAASALHPDAIAAQTALAERYKTRAFMAQLDADEHFAMPD